MCLDVVYIMTCVCMHVCVHTCVVGAADNPDMLKGAEGNKACSALAKALPACLSFKILAIEREWQDKAWAWACL